MMGCLPALVAGDSGNNVTSVPAGETVDTTTTLSPRTPVPFGRGDAIVGRGGRCCRSGACEGGAVCDLGARLVPGRL